jgi:methylated-DNA-[protein]-cysteine S-methyltransferase
MRTQKKHYINTIFGKFALEMSAKGLYAVHFPVFSRNAQRATDGVYVERCPLTVAPDDKGLCLLLKRLLCQKLNLIGCTPFQRKVYAALKKVPAGKTVTYGELAKRAGYPGAARAVGSALRKNRLPIVIPCHRVIPSTGGLGEYAAGKKWKRWLLECEKSVRATHNAQSATEKFFR